MSNDAEAALIDRDAAHLIHPLHSRSGHSSGKVWVAGEGAYLIDANGDRFIDGLAGLWCNTAGNGRVELVEAAARQMQELAYVSGYTGSSNPRAIELAERLSQLTYPNINHFYFTSGGGEATDSNIKMARYYWKLKGKPEKTKVISRVWGYHGVTIAAMCCTGMSPYWKMFEPRMPGFVHIPTPYPYRYEAPEGSQSQGIAAADELEKAILAEGADTIAMFLAEPVQGAGGVLVPQDDYFPRIREICDKYQVLLVSDEVITGFGRTGTLFGLQHWGVEPDLMQYAKAITSGYFPLGGIGVSDEIAGGSSPARGAFDATANCGGVLFCWTPRIRAPGDAIETLELLDSWLTPPHGERGVGFGPCSRCKLPLARRPVSLPVVVDRSTVIVSLVAFPKDHACACMAQLRSGPAGSECSSRAIVERNIRHSGEAA